MWRAEPHCDVDRPGDQPAKCHQIINAALTERDGSPQSASIRAWSNGAAAEPSRSGQVNLPSFRCPERDRLQPRDGPRERPQSAAGPRRRPDAPTARRRRAGERLPWGTQATLDYQLTGLARRCPPASAASARVGASTAAHPRPAPRRCSRPSGAAACSAAVYT